MHDCMTACAPVRTGTACPALLTHGLPKQPVNETGQVRSWQVMAGDGRSGHGRGCMASTVTPPALSCMALPQPV